jgi:hypothetical protein
MWLHIKYCHDPLIYLQMEMDSCLRGNDRYKSPSYPSLRRRDGALLPPKFVSFLKKINNIEQNYK